MTARHVQRIVDSLRRELADARKERDAARESCEIITCKLLTVGVIAEGKGSRNPIYARGSEWDSPQAQRVRDAMTRLDATRALVRRASTNATVTTSDEPGCFFCDRAGGCATACEARTVLVNS